jgi:cytochrome c oxidase subunit 2
MIKNLKMLRRFLPLLPLLILAHPLQASVREKNLWGRPENVTWQGVPIDQIFNFVFWMTTIVFILVTITLIWFMVKYRHKEGVPAHYSHGNNTLEIIWTTIPTVIFLGLAFYSNHVWDQLRGTPAPKNALTVEVIGHQYGWNIRYPGADGKLGASDPKLYSGGNPHGLIEGDEAAKDDIILLNEMVIPVGRPVHLLLQSRDVIHAFYVPEFRLYQDMVPGKLISWVWFEAKKRGNFKIACNQLCGSGHYKMFADLKVVSAQEYDQWIEEVKPKTASIPTTTPGLASLAR